MAAKRKATAIRMRSQRLRETEERLFAARYATRVEAARRRIVDDAGTRQRSFAPIWAGADRFEPAQTLRQADREVKQAHEQRLARITMLELSATTGLLARARREGNGLQSKHENGSTGSRLRNGPEQ